MFKVVVNGKTVLVTKEEYAAHAWAEAEQEMSPDAVVEVKPV